MIGVYKITNNVTGKSYIGQSVNIEKRVKEHFWKAFYTSDRSYECVVHQAIRKYGKNQFSWEVLEECSQEQLDERERYYIASMNTLCPNGYNRAIGGQKNKAIVIRCSRCNNQLKYAKASTTMCRACLDELGYWRKVTIPTKEVLEQDLKASNFRAVGKKYSVSDNAVRKWCRTYGMSTKAIDYK